jgi:hypothetical protein
MLLIGTILKKEQEARQRTTGAIHRTISRNEVNRSTLWLRHLPNREKTAWAKAPGNLSFDPDDVFDIIEMKGRKEGINGNSRRKK